MSNNIFFHGVGVDHRTEIVFRVLMVTVGGLIFGAVLRGAGASAAVEQTGVMWYAWAALAVLLLILSHAKTIFAYNDRLFKVERAVNDVLKDTTTSGKVLTGIYVNGFSINDGALILDDNIRYATTRCMWMVALSTAWYIVVIPQTNTTFAAVMVGAGACLNAVFFSTLIKFITLKRIAA